MDITGISYPLLALHRQGIQWPFSERDALGAAGPRAAAV